MEESERLLDDVELFLNSKSFVDESIPRKKEDIKYRDALEKVKRGEYVEATKILTKLLKEKRTSDNRNDLWNLGTRLDLRAVCYERRGLSKFAEIDRQRSRNVRDQWRKRDPKRLETIQHVESFSKANDSEAIRVLIKTSAVLVLLYALVCIDTSFRMIFMILLGLVRMRCFILFHDCTWSCSTHISQITRVSLIHIIRTPHSNKGTHGSFFKSQRLNNLVGSIVGMYVYTPFQSWRQGHRVHHEISSNLHYKQDNGQTSSPWTVQEFKNASVLNKLWYLFAFGPLSYVL